jgi:pimeloyl-ACP methyl ester carboxylesterase
LPVSTSPPRRWEVRKYRPFLSFETRRGPITDVPRKVRSQSPDDGNLPPPSASHRIPSLPGFGFSSKPVTPIGARTTARLFDNLMREGFGYPRFLAQGGDWGAGIVAWLGLEHAGSLRAIHLNHILVQPGAEPQTDQEKRWKTDYADKEQALGAYSHLQTTKPQSLAYALQNNRMAQAAWVVERFHDWSDLRERPFDEVFSKDQLLAAVMVHVMNDSLATSTWFYAAAVVEGARRMGAWKLLPAFAAFPEPRDPIPPRSWVERGYNLTRWTDLPRGGHFAAMQEPDLFVEDLRAWGREIPDS